MRILVINPGGTTTKVAVFEETEALFKETISHSAHELEVYPRVFDQTGFRTEVIQNLLKEKNIDLTSIDIVMGRGGLTRPIPGGIYRVNDILLEDMEISRYGEHASNLGPLISRRLADEIGVEAYIMDPVSVDEMEDVARISGLREIPRLAQGHALNSRAVARLAARDLGKTYEESNLITVHLGAGISVIPHHFGRMIDCNNPMEMGPFSPDRAGGLPVRSLIQLAYSGKYDQEELLRRVCREGGLKDYLGTKDLRVAEQMAENGNVYAKLILNAMEYQIAKEVGAMATVLEGKVDAIILTGGMANSDRMTDNIRRRTEFIAPVIVKAGEYEMEALAYGGRRILRGEAPLIY